MKRDIENSLLEWKNREDRKPAFAVRFSRRNLRKDGGFVNIPLYLAPRFERGLVPAMP